jgi:hypothetical protein
VGCFLFCIFVVYLTAPSQSQTTQHTIIVLSVNNELKRNGRKSVVLPGGTAEKHENPVLINSLWAEI